MIMGLRERPDLTATDNQTLVNSSQGKPTHEPHIFATAFTHTFKNRLTEHCTISARINVEKVCAEGLSENGERVTIIL